MTRPQIYRLVSGVAGAAVIALVICLIFTRSARSPQPGVPPHHPPPAPPAKTVLLVRHSTELKEWLGEEQRLFQESQQGQGIEIQLKPGGTLDVLNEILSNVAHPPDLWIPTDSLYLRLLQHRAEKNRVSLPAEDLGELAYTPLVLLAQGQGAQLLRALHGRDPRDPSIRLRDLYRIIGLSKEHWAVEDSAPAGVYLGAGKGDQRSAAMESPPPLPLRPGAEASTLLAKGLMGTHFGFTEPQRSSSGLQFLGLVILEQYRFPESLSYEDVDRDELLRHRLKELLKFALRSKCAADNSDDIARIMLQDPMNCQIAVTYESQVIGKLQAYNERLRQGKEQQLQLFYLERSMRTDHPALLLSKANEAAARAWVQHLMTQAAQERARDFGFVTVRTSVPMSEAPWYKDSLSYGRLEQMPPYLSTLDGRNVDFMLQKIETVAEEIR